MSSFLDERFSFGAYNASLKAERQDGNAAKRKIDHGVHSLLISLFDALKSVG